MEVSGIMEGPAGSVPTGGRRTEQVGGGPVTVWRSGINPIPASHGQRPGLKKKKEKY